MDKCNTLQLRHGCYGASSADFIVSAPTATFYFYGYYAGSGATIDCGTSSTCDIYCLGNGCDGLTLNCNGICSVDCDESMNIDCPNGYVGPTPGPTSYPTTAPIVIDQPTKAPSNNPTESPIGGSGESVICDETSECEAAASLFGTSVECSGTTSCQGVGSIIATSGKLMLKCRPFLDLTAEN